MLEFVAVAGGEEECVVGSGTEDEDGDDAAGGSVVGESGGEEDGFGDEGGDTVGYADDDEGEEPEDG